MEGRGLGKGNLSQQNAFRTLRRADAPSALEQVRQAAKGKQDAKFTTLMHHVYQIEALTTAYLRLKKEAAPGVDGETWRHYCEALEENRRDLAHRLTRAASTAKPVRREH